MLAAIESPKVPTAAKAPEEADAKTETKTYGRARIEDARNRIPAGPCNQRRSVHQPGIVLRNVHYLWISRLNDDGLSLRSHSLLRRIFEASVLLCSLWHHLYCVHQRR